jgi:acyl-CoA thioester hydrolase/thioesterase-3
MNSVFGSEVEIRPDDIDMNNHVHSSKYIDYVLAARYIQMRENYKMPMEEFHSLGYNWVISVSHIEFKRALKLGDRILVKTQIKEIDGPHAKVGFWILKKQSAKVAAEGYFIYTMVSLSTGKPVRISEELIKRYSV